MCPLAANRCGTGKPVPYEIAQQCPYGCGTIIEFRADGAWPRPYNDWSLFLDVNTNAKHPHPRGPGPQPRRGKGVRDS